MSDFIFNIQGLTAQDRAQWEKDNLNILKGHNYFNWSEQGKQRAFIDASTKNKYGNREDYSNIRSLPTELKMALYNADIPESQGYQEALDSITAQHSTYNSLVEDMTKDNTSIRHTELEFDELARNITPYYDRYIDTKYLPWDQNKKAEKYAEFISIYERTGNAEYAARELAKEIQNTVADNMNPLDAWMRGANGFAQSLIGGVMTGVGLIPSMAAAVFASNKDNEEVRDLNMWQRYWHNVNRNGWMELANDIATTGTIGKFHGPLAYYEEVSPDNRYNRNEIVRTVEDQKNNLKYIWDPKFLPELFANSGYTTAAITTGNITATGIKGLGLMARSATVAKGVNTAAQIAKANKMLTSIAKAENRMLAFVPPVVAGTSEGVTNALETYHTSLDKYLRMANTEYDEFIEQQKNYYKNNPEKAKELGINILTDEALDATLRQLYSSEKEDFIRRAYENSSEAMLTNFMWNSFINGFANYTLKATMFGGRVSGAIENSKIGTWFSSKSPRFSFNASSGIVSANLPGFAKRSLMTLKESAGEFAEEYLQSISDAYSQGWGENSMENFMAARLAGESYDSFAESFIENWGAAMKAAGKNAVSTEAIRAGIMGALSQGMGNVTVNRQAFNDMKNAEGWAKLGHTIRTVYRNPFVEQEIQHRTNKRAEERVAEEITKWLQEEGNLERFKSVAGAAEFIRNMNIHNEEGDEFSYRNSRSGKLINDAFIVNSLKGTELYDSYIQQFQDIINAEEGSENAKAIENNTGLPLEEAKKEAQEMISRVEEIATESEKLDKLMGRHVDPEVKKALIFGKMNLENWGRRLETLESELTGQPVESLYENKESLENAKRATSRYKVESLHQEIGKLQREIERLEENKDKKEELKNKNKRMKKLLKDFNNTLKEAKNARVLNTSVIMRLSPIERYKMINPENRKFYTEEQLEIIDILIAEKSLQDPTFTSKIEDSARLEDARLQYLEMYNKALKDPTNLNRYAYNLRAEMERETKMKQYKALNDITDRDEFLTKLDEELSKLEKDKNPLNKLLLFQAIENNPFYKELEETQNDTEDYFERIEGNKTYLELDEKQKRQHNIVASFLGSKHLNPKELESIQTLVNNHLQELEEYINKWNLEHPSVQIEYSNIGEVISSFQKVYDAILEEENEAASIVAPPAEVEGTPLPEPAPIVQEVEVPGIPENESPNTRKALYIFIDAMRKDIFFKNKQDILNSYQKYIEDILTNNSGFTQGDLANYLLRQNVEDAFIDLNGEFIKYLEKNKYAVKKINELSHQIPQIEQSPTTENNINHSFKVLLHKELLEIEKYKYLDEFYTLYGIDDYLKTHILTYRDTISFVYDPAIASGVEDSSDIPLVMVVQDSNGSYTIEGKPGKYQPIGVFVDNSSFKEEILNRRQGESKQMIDKVGGRINGFINSKSPEQISREERNLPIKHVAERDFSNPKEEDKSKERSVIRDRVLSKIKAVKNSGTNEQFHLVYRDTDNRGEDADIDIFITDPEKTVTSDGRFFSDVLLNGTEEAILSYNSRINGIRVAGIGQGFANSLRAFFENIPEKINISEETIKEWVDILNGTNTQQSKLDSYRLTRYLQLSKGYYFDLEKSGTDGEVDTFNLIIRGPKTIKGEYKQYLGTVYKGTLSDKDLVGIIRNLFLDESGKFRKVSYTNEKGETTETPLVKWNVDYNSFPGGANPETEASKNHRMEVYDDNILEISKTTLKRTITSVVVNASIIQSKPRIEGGIANSDNASNLNVGNNTNNGQIDEETGVTITGEPKKIEDNVEQSVKNTASIIIENSKRIRRSTDEKFYTEGNRSSMRVTSLLGKHFEEETSKEGTVNLIGASQAIGNSVDAFLRDLFDGKVSEMDIQYAIDHSETQRYPNISNTDLLNLYKQVIPIYNSLKSLGYKFISRIEYENGKTDGVRTTGTVVIKDKNGKIYEERASGTLDLLAYNPTTNKWMVVDFKTVRDKNISTDKKKDWAKQIALYKKFLEEEYGITITDTKVLPVHVSYPKMQYNISGDQLSVNGILFQGASPEMLEYIDIKTSEVDMTIKFEDLNQQEQDYLLSKQTQQTQSTEQNNETQTSVETTESVVEETSTQQEISKKPKILPRRKGINTPKVNTGNMTKDLGLTEEDVLISNERNPLSQYPYTRLQELLSTEEYINLTDYIEAKGEVLSKEYWESLSEKEKDLHIRCARG